MFVCSSFSLYFTGSWWWFWCSDDILFGWWPGHQISEIGSVPSVQEHRSHWGSSNDLLRCRVCYSRSASCPCVVKIFLLISGLTKYWNIIKPTKTSGQKKKKNTQKKHASSTSGPIRSKGRIFPTCQSCSRSGQEAQQWRRTPHSLCRPNSTTI